MIRLERRERGRSQTWLPCANSHRALRRILSEYPRNRRLALQSLIQGEILSNAVADYRWAPTRPVPPAAQAWERCPLCGTAVQVVNGRMLRHRASGALSTRRSPFCRWTLIGGGGYRPAAEGVAS